MLQLKNHLSDFLKKISPTSIAIFSIIILGAFLVRIHGLNEYDFNDDELWHLTVASQNNLLDLIRFNFREEVHPPLSYIIWHFMLKISHNDMWLRMSSIATSILLIPSIYVFGRLYVGRFAGYLMAMMIAFGAMPVALGTVIRAYIFMMFALTWAAIFLHKFQFSDDQKLNKKYLLYYFFCCLAAIQLNHAAIFTVSSLGFLMLLDFLVKKDKKYFFIISLIHLVLLLMVVGYSFVLKNFYALKLIILHFSNNSWIEFFENYMTFYIWFPVGKIAEDFPAQLINMIGLFSFFVSPYLLIKNRKWQLLVIVLLPLALVILADYFGFYPYTKTHRNNLFLFFSVLVSYAYFGQSIADYFYRKFPAQLSIFAKKKIWQIAICFFVTAISSSYVINRESFRKIAPNCVEFVIKKDQTKILWQKLQEKQSNQNIFVTLVRNIWYWRFKYGDEGHLTILTPNLGRYEIDGYVFYFTAMPPREKSITTSLAEYKLFFSDLFTYLEKNNQLQKVKSFTFFDIGFNIDYLGRKFLPCFINENKEPFMSSRTLIMNKIGLEGYNFGWAIHKSKNVLDKFYVRDTLYECGQEILVLSFNRQFIQEEILDKNFLDAKKIYNDEKLYKRSGGS